jgi:MFS family permease
MPRRLRAWLTLWGPVLPLLIAESTIWLGFGALLPILPLYFRAHGVDLPTLGIVVAGWPVARLVGEPFFGWLADRVSRRAMMVCGLAAASVFAVLPLFIVTPVAFVALRALQGLAASAYDPAARAYLVDANPPERQGEAFGLYGAAQTGGFVLGPALGGVAAGITGRAEVVFWIAGATLVVSALLVLARVRDRAHLRSPGSTAPPEAGVNADGVAWARPARILNVLFVAAICFNLAAFFAGGVYEVIWSVYMTSLGADVGAIGLTFFSFGLPPLLLSPFMGRFIDRSGGFLFIVVGVGGVALCGFLYPAVREIWWMVALGLVEGTAFAMASPAIYLLAARSAPAGRSSTVQGMLGGAGTVGTIVASLLAGTLASIDLHYPFYLVGIAGLTALGAGLLLGRRRLYDAMQPRPAVVAAVAPVGSPGGQPIFDGSGDRR